MICTHIDVGGTPVIVCTRGRRHRCACGATASLQCDWKVGKTRAGKVKTCDRHLCAGCGKEVAPEKHLCPEHQVAFTAWKASRVVPA